ncbi:helix-turn-helix protein [Paenibacillus cellulosilyticus]|uniref:Helix-turn-helix protein n=1 Tax=Paenibacillus cellulosilyticus TaxID=375489 RepID=A0A2V2YQQ2_9BACL|nr:helix-turn-helix domain-containing protein [Paenibacillus cellulosilyticus]PWV99336.1 helix-turn-helix protein [Paenibacillus cellulosilyticus]QKS45101.1 helix-turn-helix transcriptional regulator [Paenibacillus cellulosilyticus]
MMQGVVRARTLNDLLPGRSFAAGDMKRSLEESGLHAYYVYPALALFSVSTAEVDLWSRRHAIDELYAVIRRHAPGNTAILPDDKGHVAVIFSWDDRESITALHNTICSQEHSLNPPMISLGISNPYPHLSDLHQGYEQAVLAMKHRFYLDHSQPIYFSSLIDYASDAEYPLSMEDELLHLLTSDSISEYAATRIAVDRFYESLTRNGPLPVTKVVDVTLQLLVSLQLRVKSALGQPHLCSTPDITSLMYLRTLEELKDAVCQSLKGIGGTSYASDCLDHNVIKKAITLMEEEYDRVSLHYVADKVFITPAYLSSLFKSKMGITFIEHLTRIRIANAKKLLKQTRLKNYEVAERVGYNDSRYFSQIFKKMVGLSPSGFRDAN